MRLEFIFAIDGNETDLAQWMTNILSRLQQRGVAALQPVSLEQMAADIAKSVKNIPGIKVETHHPMQVPPDTKK